MVLPSSPSANPWANTLTGRAGSKLRGVVRVTPASVTAQLMSRPMAQSAAPSCVAEKRSGLK